MKKKRNKKKIILTIYLISSIILPIFVNFIVLPQLPMLLLNYPLYNSTGLGPSRSITRSKVNIVEDDVFLSFLDGGHLKFYKSKDSGESWEFISDISSELDIEIDTYSIDMISKDSVALIYKDKPNESSHNNSYYFTHSEDGGNTWSDPEKVLENSELPLIVYINSDFLIFVCYYDLFNCSVMFNSNNSGETWTLTYCYENIPEIANIIYSDNDALYMTTIGTCFYESTNKGENWILKSDNLPHASSSGWDDEICTDSEGNLYYALQNDYGIHLKKSEDDGKHWETVNSDKLGRAKNLAFSAISIDTDSKGDVFIVYLMSYFQVLPFNVVSAIDYFWLEKDIWTTYYVTWDIISLIPLFIGVIITFLYRKRIVHVTKSDHSEKKPQNGEKKSFNEVLSKLDKKKK